MKSKNFKCFLLPFFIDFTTILKKNFLYNSKNQAQKIKFFFIRSFVVGAQLIAVEVLIGIIDAHLIVRPNVSLR